MSGAISYYERLLPAASTLSPDEFRAALASLGLTQKEFAVLVGVNDRTVREWANKIRTPAPVTVLLHVLQAHYRPLAGSDMGEAIAAIIKHAQGRTSGSGDIGKALMARLLSEPEREQPTPKVTPFVPPRLPRSVRLSALFRPPHPDLEPQAVEISKLADVRRPPGSPLDPRLRPPEVVRAEQDPASTK